MSAPLLVIDDEAAIRSLVRRAAERAGWGVAEAADAREGLDLARRTGCEVVLLDLGLPDRDGVEIIPQLKAAGRSVIVLTARDSASEKVTALDLGADDYLVKPFDTEELLARVRVAFRNRGRGGGELVRVGPIAIDLARRVVTRDERALDLPPKEFALLLELARNADRVVTHRHLLEAVWGPAHVADLAYLRVAVRNLRQKLEADPARPSLLINVPAIGYRLRSQ
ncbi:response regulator transcription factor [Sphingomonas sp. ASV193]|uniref:response regulator transcription factor n=1 Tax=Sphingomonas sp. ASV193 TaxID=3144405 RepID=UPI0032E8B59F